MTSSIATAPWIDCEQSAHATRGSRLAARGSRLEYRTRFLAAPPAGILEQKRDCSQSTPWMDASVSQDAQHFVGFLPG